MGLEQKIDQDLKEAMAARDAEKVAALRYLKSALKYSAIEKKSVHLTDAEVQQVLQKQIKQRHESIEQFSKAKRLELAEKESKELHLLESYLPAQIPDAELEKFVSDELREAGVGSRKDFGRMMKLLNEKLKGQADAKRVAEILGKFLQ